MAEYTPSYEQPYTEGFVNAPPYDTPITAEVLNAIANAISAIEKYLHSNPIEESGGSSVDLDNLVVANSISLGRNEDTVIGARSTAEGESVTASGNDSHAEGYNTTASGYDSHAEGYNTTASGNDSHAEGGETVASGVYDHAEGYMTTASGGYNHAEGYMTTASGGYSHSEGSNCQAKAVASHSEGLGTLAGANYQHVQGKYNVEDIAGKYAHIVGNGSSSTARANAHTLDWEGNAWYAGTVECNGIILTDTEDDTKRYLIQVTNGQLVATEITAAS